MSRRGELLAAMRDARDHLEAAVAAHEGRLDADLGGGWRLREVLAHISLWERVAVRKLTGASLPDGEDLATRAPWDLNAFNDAMRERWQARTDKEILAEFAASHRALVAAVETAPDEACAPGGKAWQAVDEDGAGHYHHHFPIPDVMAERWPNQHGTG